MDELKTASGTFEKVVHHLLQPPEATLAIPKSRRRRRDRHPPTYSFEMTSRLLSGSLRNG